MMSLDDLSDDALLRAFEEGTLPPGAFHHRDHVRTAWALLEQRPVLESRYYREETRWSARAREAFVLPDRPLTA